MTLHSGQILAGKTLNRSLQPPVRDLYDFAVAGVVEPAALEIAVNALTPREIRARLLRWELERDEYARQAQAVIHDVPHEYETLRTDPATRAIEAVQRAVYRRARIHVRDGQAIVHTESLAGSTERAYGTVAEIDEDSNRTA